MTTFYLDADGPLRLLVAPAKGTSKNRMNLTNQAMAMQDFLRGLDDSDSLISTKLLRVEVLRTLRREGLDPALGQDLLNRIKFAELTPADFERAAQLPMRALRTVDALHFSAASRLPVDVLVTYDQQLVSAASEIDLPTVSPGA